MVKRWLRPLCAFVLGAAALSMAGAEAWAQTAKPMAQAGAAAATTAPAFTQASTWHYRVSTAYFGDSITRAEMRFEPLAKQGYRASLVVRVAGQSLVRMQAQGQIQGAQLLPTSYEERVLGSRSAVQQKNGQVIFQAGKQRYPAPEGLLDSVSLNAQLQQWLASGALPAQAGASRDVWLMRPEGIFHWRYTVADVGQMTHPELGRIAVVHIIPQALGKGTAQSELWFAPSLGYAPVRIKMQLLDHSWVDMNWTGQ